jgi:hypothetical protein
VFTPIAAHVLREQFERQARAEAPAARRTRETGAVRRLAAAALRRSADRLAPQAN